MSSKKSKKSKASSVAQAVQALEVTINRFKTSSRYPFLKEMAISHFATELMKSVPALEELSFSQICDMGAEEVSKLPALGTKRLGQLTDILEKLMLTEAASGESAASGLTRTGKKKIPVYNSIEAEQLLSEAFERLRKSDIFSQLKDKKVEEFWDTSIIRAPFIEMLTFRELVGIKVDSLLKKRSFGNTKVHGLLKTIEGCLEESTQENSNNIEQHTNQRVSKVSPMRLEKWPAASLSFPSYIVSLMNFYEEQRNLAISLDSSFARLIVQIPTKLSQDEFFIGWLSLEHEQESLDKIIKISHKQQKKLIESGQTALLKLAKSHCSRMLEMWEVLLTSVYVPEDKLLQSYLDDTLDHNLQTIIARMILLASGAQLPRAFGHTFKQAWTKIDKGLELTLNSIKTKKDLQTLIPLADPTTILSIIPNSQRIRDE